MINPLFAYFQYLIPKHLLTQCMGKLAECRTPWFKNWFIRRFIKLYRVDMTEARISTPESYATFNEFFTRELKEGIRPISPDEKAMVSPADGSIAQIGKIQKNLLLQAKNFYFDLETLLGGNNSLASQFYDGEFATIYLAPHNYHRVHMPVDGKLLKTIYVPGNLFSVNNMTSSIIPHLYSRNERLICVFETPAGVVTIILVGALIVGSIKTVWMKEPIRKNKITTQVFTDGITLKKGQELGYFKIGSTVILLCENKRVNWLSSFRTATCLQMGETIGQFV